MTCTLNPIKPTWQALRHLPLAIQMSLAMTLIDYLIILADRELTLGQVENAEVRKPKSGNGSTETEVRK